MKQSFYEILGVSEKASPEEIKAAFRKKAIKAHPDKGGSVDEMALLNRVYRCLINPQSRLSYDETGSDTLGTIDVEKVAKDMIIEKFMAVLKHKIPNGKVLEHVRRAFNKEKNEINTAQRTMKEVEDMLERRRDTLTIKKSKKKKKKDGKIANLWTTLIDDRLKELHNNYAASKKQLVLLDVALKLLDDYDEKEPEKIDVSSSASIASWISLTI